MLRSAAAAAVLLAAGPAAAHAAGHYADADPALDAAAPAPAPTPAADPADVIPAEVISADPWERQNRKYFRWNERLDARFIRPSALGYQRHTPGPLRRALRNFLNNLTEPIVFANDVLQLRPYRAAASAFRFACNSTVGLAGLFDVAALDGVPYRSNDFGVTLGRYGVPAGPYVYLPLVGPSTVRDLAGSVVDGVADPFGWARSESWVIFNSAKTLAGGLDTRAAADSDLQALSDQATDPYASLRSAYLQSRDAEIKGELGSKDRPLPDFDADPTPAPAGQPQDTPKANAAKESPSGPPSDPQAGAERLVQVTVAFRLPVAVSDAVSGKPASGEPELFVTRLQQERTGD